MDTSIEISQWFGCYDASLKAFITPESFAHPAKMALNLCRRIFEHGEARGYWRPNDIIADPFGGIGTTGLVGAYAGYRVVMCELEPRFVGLNQANIDRNAAKLKRLGNPLPVVVQGDSRDFASVIEQAVGAISSPPFTRPEARDRYASQSGEIASNLTRAYTVDRQGTTDGNIAALEMSDFDQVIGAVSSPPYENSVNQSAGSNDSAARLDRKANAGVDVTQAVKRGGPNSVLNQPQVYGVTTGQIGAESKETYWSAMAQVYAQLYRVLAPGGVAAIVVKDYVRNKSIVPLCDQTAQLLEAVGFSIVERTHAMLVKESHLGVDMFSGQIVMKKTERKSFFRRLCEAKGSPAIDWEEVIWAQKPA